MDVVLHKMNLEGDVVIPPSKSLSHRYIIAASLAGGVSKISNIMYSADIKATINACRALGANIECFDNYLIINGVSKVSRVSQEIDCNESGSTVRFMIPIAMTLDKPCTFIGHNNLVNRPLEQYLNIFDKFDITYKKEDSAYLPLTVNNSLKPGKYELRGDISSQFITGLLYALPLLDGDSEIILTSKLMSKGYVDLSLDVLEKYGIKIINNNYSSFYIKGQQHYVAADYSVPGDYSQAAFFIVAGALGANIRMLGMNEDSLQGDKKIIDDVNSLGGNVYFDNGVLYSKKASLKGNTIDLGQTPDSGPALSILCSLASGKSKFTNAKRLRIKECDRITDMAKELKKLGAITAETEDTMSFDGVSSFIGNTTLDGHNDHRVVMALSMAKIVTSGDLKILGAEAINKSFPHFFETLIKLGADISYE